MHACKDLPFSLFSRLNEMAGRFPNLGQDSYSIIVLQIQNVVDLVYQASRWCIFCQQISGVLNLHVELSMINPSYIRMLSFDSLICFLSQIS
jgi:hypothetical protein